MRTRRPNGSTRCSPRTERTARRRRRRRPRRPRRRRRRRPARRHSVSVWAVLAAAGRGERLGDDRPKGFARLGHPPLVAEPLRRLDDSDWIDGIIVAAPAGGEEPVIVLAEELAAGKVRSVVSGADTRAGSVRGALADVPDEAAVIVVHDAARPLVTDDVLGRVLAPLSEGYDGAVPVLPVVDTVKRVRHEEIVETLD